MRIYHPYNVDCRCEGEGEGEIRVDNKLFIY